MRMVWAIGVFFFALGLSSVAAPVSSDQARGMVVGWQTLAASPMGSAISKIVSSVEPVCDEQGRTLYYIVQMAPEGFVLVPSDDEIEPLIAFSSQGVYERDERNPLSALMEADMHARLEALSAARLRAEAKTLDQNTFPAKWRCFSEAACPRAFASKALEDLDDLRVAPLTRTEWAQGAVEGRACFNYYTPPYGPGVPSNYPGGCTQTAWAQIMRFHRWPQASIGVVTRTIQVDGVPKESSTRGLAYGWDLMPLAPDGDTPELQRQAIGGLIHDLGVVNQASYMANGTASGMSVADLVQVFGYSNAKYTSPNYAALSNILECAINANLDAGLVAQLSLTGGGSHAVVVDGYGYHAGAAMHHLNLGWGGNPDAWYQLPEVGEYNGLAGVVYNIYTNGTGEIVSGRTLDINGSPIPGTEVRIARNGWTNTTLSNERGMYTFSHLLSGEAYALSASCEAYRFPGISVTTGVSPSHGAPGNRWGLNLIGLPVSHAYVSGMVTNRGGEAIAGVSVWINGMPGATTDAEGKYCVWIPWGQSAIISVGKEGYDFDASEQSVDMGAGDMENVNFCGSPVFFVDGQACGTGNGQSWPNAFVHLQQALEIVPTYSEIWVARGTYRPREDSRSNRFDVGAGVHLLGGFVGTETEESKRLPLQNETVLCGDIGIEGDRSDNVATVLNVSTQAWVDGFTIRNGWNTNAQGGGVRLADASATLANCRVVSNVAANGGGVFGGTLSGCLLQENEALAGGGAQKSEMTDCQVISNRAHHGGGVFTCTLANSLLQENKASYWGGGAIDSDLIQCRILRNQARTGGGASSSSLGDCELSGNLAQNEGGGAYGCDLTNCTLTGNGATNGGGTCRSTLNDCELSNNSAVSLGGGAYQGTLIHCSIVSNRAYRGGGGDSLELERCLLADNYADNLGGGAYHGALNNCVLLRNQASGGGGAYWSALKQCTVAGNLAFRGGGAEVCSLYNSILYFNEADWGADAYYSSGTNCCTTTWLGNGGNITNAPQFVNAVAGDYHLAAISPCIDAGSNQWVAASADLDGNPRIIHDRTDMGAYEFQGVPTTYGAWAAAMGGGATNELESAAGDGIPNLLRYAMGGESVSPTEWVDLDAGQESAGVAIRFHRNIEAKDLVMRLESTFSLSDESAWQGLATNIGGSWKGSIPIQEDGCTNPALVIVCDPAATNGTPTRYYRLHVRRP